MRIIKRLLNLKHSCVTINNIAGKSRSQRKDKYNAFIYTNVYKKRKLSKKPIEVSIESIKNVVIKILNKIIEVNKNRQAYSYQDPAYYL